MLALYALNQTKGRGSRDTNLTAYALPAWGWIVVALPWDMYIVVGNDCAFNTNAKSPQSFFELRFGTSPVALTAEGKFKSYLANVTTTPRETAFARWYANPRLIAVKWRGFVWAMDERSNIATVDKGHFLGKCLQGTQATCSALITSLLAQPGADLEPLQSSTVGRGARHHRAAWR
jgi:hypothetical protein